MWCVKLATVFTRNQDIKTKMRAPSKAPEVPGQGQGLRSQSSFLLVKADEGSARVMATAPVPSAKQVRNSWYLLLLTGIVVLACRMYAVSPENVKKPVTRQLMQSSFTSFI